jgi:hypothetical protein
MFFIRSLDVAGNSENVSVLVCFCSLIQVELGSNSS